MTQILADSTNERHRFSLDRFLFVCVLFSVAFPTSYLLLSYYTAGDQLAYRAYYDAIGAGSLVEAVRLQPLYLSSQDPAYGFIMWFGAAIGVPKDAYTSLFNSLLIILLLKVLLGFKAPTRVILLLLSNQYLFVLLATAERLKFSYLFLVTALLLHGRWRIMMVGLAPLAHTQTIILYFSLLSAMSDKLFTYESLRGLVFGRVPLLYAIATAIVIFAGMASILAVGPLIYSKLSFYSTTAAGLSEAINAIALLTVGLICARKKRRMLFGLFPLVIAAYILGGGRVNMIAFSVFTILLLVENRLSHPMVLLPLAYLSYRSIGFITNLVAFGEPFPTSSMT